MNRDLIAVEDFKVNPFKLLSEEWLLLSAGDFASGKFNMMTIAWGSFGCMWNKPLAMVVVRPARHTFGFMEDFDSFTVCAFPPALQSALSFCGANSGRDVDKIAKSGLSPIASQEVASPSFAEAELVLECRKMYFNDFVPDNFLLPEIADNYKGGDYHRMYFGEILSVFGTEKYKS